MNINGTKQIQSDEELMTQLKAGQSSALSVLYDRYFSRIYRYFFHMLNRDEEVARDFAQDLFMKIINKPHLYQEGRSFSTWAFTMAANMCKNEFRNREVRYRNHEIISKTGDHLAENAEQMDREQFQMVLKDEMQNLDDKHREVVILRFNQELSIKEIAEIVEVSEGTVKSRIFYGLKKLKEKLKEYNPL